VVGHGNTSNQFNYISEISIDGNTIESVIISPVNFGLKDSQSTIDPTTPTSSRSEILSQITGNTYYLDQINGDDNDIGTQASPWKTLSKAQSSMISGDCVILASGDYGAYEEANVSGRTDYILYIADENATVHFDTISITNSSLMDTYLIFHGINIQPDWVDPASSDAVGSNDPQYPDSNLATYAKTINPISLYYSKYVTIINCTISGQNKHLTLSGISMSNNQQIKIEYNNITKTQRGIAMSSNSNVDILYNHIHEITSTAIGQTDANNFYNLIEGNYGHDSNYTVTEDYAPRAAGSEYHGSAVSIRNGYTTIRNNVFHDGFSSSGIMAYGADSTGTPHHDNITIENNLLYDIHNVYVLRIYLMGDNFTVRNNTFIGQRRSLNDGRYRYNTALAIHSLDTDGTPHLNAYNNIFVGIFNVGNFASNVTKINNISWSFAHSTIFFCEGSPEVGATDSVLSCGYFENPEQEVTDLFNEPITLEPFHSQFLDFTLNLNSFAINYGDPTVQASDSLGLIDSSQNFIEKNGATRSTVVHSAGAYEPH